MHEGLTKIIGRDLLPDSVIDPPSQFATSASLDIDEGSSLFDVVDAFERRVIIERLQETGSSRLLVHSMKAARIRWGSTWAMSGGSR